MQNVNTLLRIAPIAFPISSSLCMLLTPEAELNSQVKTIATFQKWKHSTRTTNEYSAFQTPANGFPLDERKEQLSILTWCLLSIMAPLLHGYRNGK